MVRPTLFSTVMYRYMTAFGGLESDWKNSDIFIINFIT